MLPHLIKRAQELARLGLMHPAGLKAFEEWDQQKSARYSYEQRQDSKLAPAYEHQFKANQKAWAFFQSKPASYPK